jgi:2-hydroxychromene-2-carboxylate isomerase
MTPTIEFWFDFGSNYSYLSALRIEELARARGITVAYRPFLLGPVFKALGWETSPFVVQKQKGAYVWRDMEREARKYGLAWTRPTAFPRRALLPLRVATAAEGQPWQARFIQRIFQANFVDDRDIDDPALVRSVLEDLGVDAAALLAAAEAPATKQLLRERTEEAQRREIFGAPMFFAAGDKFWGNDRLLDALDSISTTIL